MDYKSFWKGTLTRQDWEAQWDPRYERRLSKEQYAELTRDVFRGMQESSDKQWRLALGARPSPDNHDNLELTWAGFGTNTFGDQSIQGK
ncbi:hypothetical protein BGZ94_003402, partial [Podila epigama]